MKERNTINNNLIKEEFNMPHRHPHKPVHHIKPKYKKLALIAAAAAVLSTTSLPGMPVSIVHAAANDMSASTSQQVGKTNDSSSRINLEQNKVPKTANHSKQENKTKESSPKKSITAPKEVEKKTAKTPTPKATETKTVPVSTSKTTGETAEKNNTPKQKENNTKSPVETPKPTKESKEKNQTPQPSKDTTKDTTSSTPKEEAKPPASDNTPNHYKEVLDISATAYAPGPHDNEQWGNKTYIGTEVRPGIIAVDPKLIPLGSRVYIEYPDGHGEYAIAEDTGGAIKGNRIDIAKQTVSEAEDFGIQKVKVYVVKTPEKA